MALSSMIRGVESATPLPAKFTCSLFYIILSSLMIIYYRVKEGSNFRLPWTKEDGTFSGKQFFAIVLGGTCEFFVQIAVIMCFNAA